MAKRKRPHPVVDEIRSVLKTSPFLGMIIHTSDGESFRVSHPDYLMIGPTGEFVHCYDDDQHPHFLNVRQIVSIEPARPKKSPPASRAGGRG
jgi:hypothetical protein